VRADHAASSLYFAFIKAQEVMQLISCHHALPPEPESCYAAKERDLNFSIRVFTA